MGEMVSWGTGEGWGGGGGLTARRKVEFDRVEGDCTTSVLALKQVLRAEYLLYNSVKKCYAIEKYDV